MGFYLVSTISGWDTFLVEAGSEAEAKAVLLKTGGTYLGSTDADGYVGDDEVITSVLEFESRPTALLFAYDQLVSDWSGPEVDETEEGANSP